MHRPEETIVALSTPPGKGALALVRLSGPDALDLARGVFKLRSNAPIDAGHAMLGRIVTTDGAEEIDTGYLTYHPARRSYTGQDVVELTCHGSPVVVERILEELIRAGARPADPGEFTYRAVLNGRMDLAQAEGVRDLIEAPTVLAARAAHEQIRGELSRRVSGLRAGLVETISRAEASLEFAEEPDVAGAEYDLSEAIGSLSSRVGEFLATYRRGRLLRHGARVVLAGRPNSGKSSLFNHLLRTERAIVAPQPGTTRDYLTERIDLHGIPVTLIDTAGLRAGSSGAEREGVDRARRMIDQADLILILCAVDAEPDAEDLEMLQRLGDRAILLASKSDLAPDAPPWAARRDAVAVSSKTGQGVPALRERIFRALAGSPFLTSGDILLADARHHAALKSCADRLRSALASVEAGSTEEVTLVDLYAALHHLEEITGEVAMEEIYDRIFSTFCVGK